MKFKIGDRVKVINDTELFNTVIGDTGVVIDIFNGDYPYCVRNDRNNKEEWVLESQIKIISPKIKEVANLLGVDLCEEFYAIDNVGHKQLYMITLDGLEVFNKYENCFVWCTNSALQSLILGYAVIVKKNLFPKCGDVYYCVDISESRVFRFTWEGDTLDMENLFNGNFYKTKKEAENRLKRAEL